MNEENPFEPDPVPSASSRRSANPFSPWRAFQTLVAFAFIVATLFTLWTPANLFSNELLDQMMKAYNQPAVTPFPTLTPGPRPPSFTHTPPATPAHPPDRRRPSET